MVFHKDEVVVTGTMLATGGHHILDIQVNLYGMRKYLALLGLEFSPEHVIPLCLDPQ